MDQLLTFTILKEIYGYMDWSNLMHMGQVPEHAWQSQYRYLCQDRDFKNGIKDYWGEAEKLMSYKVRIMNYIGLMMMGWEYTPKIISKNRNFILDSIRIGCKKKTYGLYPNDKEVMLAEIKIEPWSLRHASKELQDDREWILNAIRENGFVVFYVKPEWKSDMEILTTAANQLSIMPIEDPLELYRTIAWEAVRLEPNMYIEDVKDVIPVEDDDGSRLIIYNNLTKETAMEAVKNGCRMLDVPIELRNDKDFMLQALKLHPCYRLRKYKTHALYYDPCAIIGDSLKINKEFVLNIITNMPFAYRFSLDSTFNDDMDIQLTLVKRYGYPAIQKAFKLRQNKIFMKKVIEYDSIFFDFASNELKSDPDFINTFRKYNKNWKPKYIEMY